MSSVSAAAVGELREIVDELLQEFVGGESIRRALEEDRDNKWDQAPITSGMVQLQLQVESLSEPQVLAGGVEDKVLQDIVCPSESKSVDG